ncbi:MAG: hypothetical protein RLZZ316_1692 [Bacteroidota bacterium]|jgi:hypothetical protein
MKYALLLLTIAIMGWGCANNNNNSTESKTPASLPGTALLHANQYQLTQVIIYDVFAPPVASRIYAYTSLAAYEALRHNTPGYASITAQLHGFKPMPLPEKDKKYNYLLAATKAYFTVAEKITFSIDSLKQYQDSVFAIFKNALPQDEYERSLTFGDTVGKTVLVRSTTDNYKKTRGMDRFLGSNAPGKWLPTSPDYLDGTEPNWKLIVPLVLDTASQIAADPPPAFGTEKTSALYKVADEVYNISKNLTDEQKLIARYWDDNPAVMEHSGHMMFLNKKITPVGHWIGIAGIAAKKANSNDVETARAYAVTAVAVFDAFISCWHEKYKSQLIRPISYINQFIDKNWQPYLQTPPFPEHTSGHSTISAAAATVLTNLYGATFSFHDDSDKEYIGMERDFSSFDQAAQEASISRVYGGIHYTTGCNAGNKNGTAIGTYINQKIKLKE